MRAATVHQVAIGPRRALSLHEWAGRGRPLILLHGLLDSAEGWDDFARTTKRPCLAFDLPGFGDSDLPRKPRLYSYAEDLLAALDTLGIEQFDLVGHSLGGGVATAIAEEAPERVRSLTLLAPVGFGKIHIAEALLLPGVRAAFGITLPLMLSNPVALTAAYMAFVANGHTPDNRLVKTLRKRAFQCAPGARMAVEAIIAANHRSFGKSQLGYSGPVRALWGRSDRLVPPSHKHGLKTAYPQAEVAVWAGMGHHPQHERPGQLVEFIESACTTRARRRQPATKAPCPLPATPGIAA